MPASLLEATLLTEKSELVRKALGEHVFSAFIQNKKIEWDQYRTQVTEYELDRYLPILYTVTHRATERVFERL